MRKRSYIKPDTEIFIIQEQEHLMALSLTDINTNLDEEDDIELQEDDEEVGYGFWGR
jgi:hypothetical protein